jgi:hypothetical protein
MVLMIILKPCDGQEVVCPSTSVILPCSCSASTINPIGLAIDCASAGLSDSEMSYVLNAFLSPDISPVIELEALGNQLTQVPSQLSQFTSITTIDFSGDNHITSIPVGSIVSFATNINMFLYFNGLTTVPLGAFIFPNAESIYIGFNSNSITTIVPGAFNFPNASNIIFDFGSNQISTIAPDTFTPGKT